MANRKNDNARCVAYMTQQIWSLELELLIVTLYSEQDNNQEKQLRYQVVRDFTKFIVRNTNNFYEETYLLIC